VFPWLGGIASICALVVWGTPVAIIIWMVAHRRANPKAAIRPGGVALAVWFAMTLVTVFFGLLSAGGHTPSSIQMLGLVWALVVVGICARMLWELYGKIGLPKR
jgi:hypothetical protein